MTLTGTQFLQTISDRGIPDQWQRLGWVPAYDGAISTHIVRAVHAAYRADTAEARDAVQRLFDEKLDNLDEARTFQALPPSVVVVLVVLESVRFNFTYIKERGFRSFYGMTDSYLAEIVTLTEEGRAAFEADLGNETFPPFWLFKLDLNSIEVPTHCDICRLVIIYAEHALDSVT